MVMVDGEKNTRMSWRKIQVTQVELNLHTHTHRVRWIRCLHNDNRAKRGNSENFFHLFLSFSSSFSSFSERNENFFVIFPHMMKLGTEDGINEDFEIVGFHLTTDETKKPFI